MCGRTYGYARVSTREQHLDRQVDALRGFGVADADLYADRASGRDFERPAWKRLMRRLRPGDVLAVKSIDRLGRSYGDILEAWRRLTRERGVAMVVLDMPLLDTRRAHAGVAGELIADITLQLLSYVAHVERESIRQRQAEGIAAARARGVRFGRPRKERPDGCGEVLALMAEGGLTRREAARLLGVSLGTLDRWRKEGTAGRAD